MSGPDARQAAERLLPASGARRAELEAALAELWPAGDVPLVALLPAAEKLRSAGQLVDALVAVAAMAGDRAALARLDGQLVEACRRVEARKGAELDELAQAVRERLLSQKAGGPKLARYDAQGPLSAWLRTVAARTSANARRGHAREDATASVPESAAPGADAELALLRLEHRAHFKAAFALAVGTLSPRERTVLKLHTLDGLSLARIGAIYRKDASTVSRWLEQTRETLRARTRAALASALKLEAAELDSVLRAADSQLTVSLAGLLEGAADVPPAP